MDNKKNIIIVLSVAIAAIGVFIIFTGGDDGADRNDTETKESKFFSPEDVKEGDTVININASGDFSPAEVSIQKGDRVVWVNKSDRFAWPASDVHPTHEIYSEFDPLEPMAPGEVWAFVFEKAGEWRFHDHLRPSKTGVVGVSE